MFIFAMRSPKTKEKVVGRLRMFFDYIGIHEDSIEEQCKAFVEKGITDNTWIFTNLVEYLRYQKERVEKKEISAGTVKNYFQAVKLFCEMNQIELQWKRISRALPKVRRYAIDRSPTLEEIRKICEYPDRRIKPIIYVMSSSGIRLGAWDYLKWKHVIPIHRDDKLVGAKLIVYAGESEEYFTFITLEAYLELKKWMGYRKQCGENINLDSCIMRNRWDKKKGYSRGLISIPKKLKATGVKRIIEDALWTQQVRTKLDGGKKRHEFQADHGFRKWFKTRCELAGMKSINIENLMGHSTGISDSYYRPTEHEIFQDYLRAVNSLTIDDANLLKNKVEQISQKNTMSQIIFDSKLLEKDKEIKDIQEQLRAVIAAINSAGESGKIEIARNLVERELYK